MVYVDEDTSKDISLPEVPTKAVVEPTLLWPARQR
jgi:hypothetical protein